MSAQMSPLWLALTRVLVDAEARLQADRTPPPSHRNGLAPEPRQAVEAIGVASTVASQEEPNAPATAQS
jgi:hypothetical protein